MTLTAGRSHRPFPPQPIETARMRCEELLDQVHGRDSFVAFVRALAEEREEAEGIERLEKVSGTVAQLL